MSQTKFLLLSCVSFCVVGCGEQVAEPSADESVEVATANQELTSTRHQQTTRAGVEAWVNAAAAQRLESVSTIGDTNIIANSRSQTHFDNCYWNESRDWIILNRNQAVQAAIQYYQTNDINQYNLVFDSLGYVLHASEDFYSHSNWVETHAPGVLAPFNDPNATAPAGWYSGTYNNPGDTGPNAGAAHCPAGTPSHSRMNKDWYGSLAADEAFLDASLAATDQIKRFIEAVRAAVPESTASAVLAILGFNATVPARATSRSDFRRVVTPNGGSWGLAAPAIYCSPGSYVGAFAQRVETSQGAFDDTALNTVVFYCKTPNGSWVEPLNVWEGVWGSWSPWSICATSGGFISGGELKVESPQGAGDDTSANAARFWCNDGSALTATNDGPWGSWRGRGNCGTGEAVCGVQIKYEAPQGVGDDTAMNGMLLHCCSY